MNANHWNATEFARLIRTSSLPSSPGSLKAKLVKFLPGAILIAGLVCLSTLAASSQTTPSARQIGTVKEISANKLKIATDAGVTVSVGVTDGARVLQLAPGSTDLKTAQAIALGDIEIGDRVLVTGHQDAPDAFTAARVILMKSTDIAQKHEAEQEDWQKRGVGGLVSSVDASTGTVAITSHTKKISVETTPATIYRRYSDGSVKFEDAKLSSFAAIQNGDQLRVRGAKSDDGSSIKAEEVVTGSFKNLAGTVISIDSAAGTISLKDLATKKTYSITVTANSSIRALPPEDAARFAARAKNTASSDAAPTASPKRPPADGVAVGDPHSGPGGGSAGMDLSQLVNRLPQSTLGSLHAGDALMVVASQSQAGSDAVTAITVLAGVEPILSATPKGAASMTLSPWNVSGSPDGGGM